MTSLDPYFQPTYPTDREENTEGLIKCDCCHECGSYRPYLMLEGYDGDRFYVKHKEAYLDNFKSDLLESDFKELEIKINKQL